MPCSPCAWTPVSSNCSSSTSQFIQFPVTSSMYGYWPAAASAFSCASSAASCASSAASCASSAFPCAVSAASCASSAFPCAVSAASAAASASSRASSTSVTHSFSGSGGSVSDPVTLRTTKDGMILDFLTRLVSLSSARISVLHSPASAVTTLLITQLRTFVSLS